MMGQEYREDISVQNGHWVGDMSESRVRIGGHGTCDECDRDLNCACEQDYRVHWCRRHETMESE